MITDFTGLEPPDVREIGVDRVALAYRSPMVTAHGTISQRNVVVLTLVDAEGRTGRGEAAPLTAFTPETVDGAERALRRWADDGAEPTGSPTARAAIDGALLDLAAKAAERPLHDLLAPGSPGVVPVSKLVVGATPDEAAAAAASAVALGHRTVKVKVAAGLFEADLARLKAVRDAIGDARLRIDANGGWTIDEAPRHLERLADLEIEFVEEPVSGLDALAAVRATSPIPLAVDESITTQEDLDRAISLVSADVVVLKPSAMGGPLVTAAAARTASEAGLTVVVTSLLEGSVGIGAAAHLASALGALDPAPGLATASLLHTDNSQSLLPRRGALHLD
ncbi:MAG TPA: o-succinylbenzoate synthase [Acidimicrobiales bacterium]|nr:o-succinylbenzoate synthase [Acidimicrobiales bacterium]